MDNSEDSFDMEFGIKKFIEFLTADCADKEEDHPRREREKAGREHAKLTFPKITLYSLSG